MTINTRRRWMFSIGIMWLGFSFLLPLSAGQPQKFPYYKPLQPEEPSQGKLGVFVLDEDIFSATDDRYANLRLFAAEGNEVPFLVRTQRQETSVLSEQAAGVTRTGFTLLPDNRMEIEFQRKETNGDVLPITGITIQTDVRNFEKLVWVQAREPSGEWKEVVKRRPIFDYSRYMDVRNTRVDLPDCRHQAFKVVLSDITESKWSPLLRILQEQGQGEVVSEIKWAEFQHRDFRIDSVIFYESKVKVDRRKPVTASYSVSDFSVRQDAKKRATIVAFQTRRSPLTSLELDIGDSNFSRRVSVEGRDDGAGEEAWVSLTSIKIERLRLSEIVRESTRVVLPRPCRYRRYRLTIQNQDNPPLAIKEVRAAGEVHEALFYLEEEGSRTVYYGGTNIPQPRYDIDQVVERARPDDFQVFALGAQTATKGFTPKPDPGFDGRQLLIPAIFLMVGVLVWVIFRSARLIESTDNGSDQ